ncbi:MAG: phosphonoacetaldehyde reductase, partial [Thermoplasmatales archaeon]|nr:phosphonoacetaldehyde reductase [Thermoplasmatales archaeon]
ALSQCIESHWSLNSTKKSREYSLAGLKAITSNYKSYLMNDLEASRAVMRGANFSGKAINITRTTAPHALSYKITKEYGIPHGCAVAVTLMQFWNHLLLNLDETTHPDGKGFMEERLKELSCAFGGENLLDGRKIADKMIIDILPKKDIQIDDVQKIISEVNADRLRNYPLSLNMQDLESILSQTIKQL